MIQFLLNDQVQQVEDVDPNTSVLNYLREYLHRTGTKEGCASGDCGACTVVVGDVENGSIRYRNINACIALLPTLHGKQLITVEDLKQGDTLHPVQQAMVDCHGSQCGFCTPGFVMSLFALRKNNASPSRSDIESTLAGNLCRCTGYRPIIDAANKMYESPLEDQFTAMQQAWAEQLQRLKQTPASLEANGKRYFAPSSLAELSDLLARYPNAKLLAGGTDLSLEITQFLREIETLIYLGNVPELLAIEEAEQALQVGAAVTYEDCYKQIETLYPAFDEVFERLGSKAIRNVGTIGGNIGNASPIGDMPPGLIALGAKVVLQSAQGERNIVLEDYFVDYKVTALKSGEFIKSIEIPKPEPDGIFKMYKISKRLDDDISATCGAFSLQLEGGVVKAVRIAFGGMAAIPCRAKHCEAALLGKTWNQETINKAMAALEQDYNPLSDARASSQYRMQVSKNLLQRCFLEVQDQNNIIRVTQYA